MVGFVYLKFSTTIILVERPYWSKAYIWNIADTSRDCLLRLIAAEKTPFKMSIYEHIKAIINFQQTSFNVGRPKVQT